jgi:hypothetical protein
MSGMAERHAAITGIEGNLRLAMQGFEPMFSLAQTRKSEPEFLKRLEAKATLLRNAVADGAAFALEIKNKPSPLPYEESYLSIWKKADCYRKVYYQWKYGRPAAEVGGTVSPPLMTVTPGVTAAKMAQETAVQDTPPTPMIIADEGEEIQTIEEAGMPNLMKWGLLAFVAYLGVKALRK